MPQAVSSCSTDGEISHADGGERERLRVTQP